MCMYRKSQGLPDISGGNFGESLANMPDQTESLRKSLEQVKVSMNDN